MMRNLLHENIVQYYGTSIEDNHLNIFLEYVPGGSISSLLNKFGGFSESVVRVYTRQILSGLAYLHQHQIIHRGILKSKFFSPFEDIKGANILVDNNGTVKLADFGASKKLEGNFFVLLMEQDLINATMGFRSLAGTPYYMAPEVIKQSGHGRFIFFFCKKDVSFLEGKPIFGASVVQCMKCLMENLLGMKSMTKFLQCFILHHQMLYLLFPKIFQKKEEIFYECASIESLLLGLQLLLYLSILSLKMLRGNYKSLLTIRELARSGGSKKSSPRTSPRSATPQERRLSSPKVYPETHTIPPTR